MSDNPACTLLLPKNLACLAKLTAKGEQIRFGATQGVQLSRTKLGYSAVATDGRVAAMVEGEPEHDAADYPGLSALASAPNSAASSIVPAKEWANAFKTAPKEGRHGKPILSNVACVMGNDITTLASTNLETVNVQTPRNLDGRFPNIKQVIPARNAVVTVAVDPKLLASVLLAAAEFTTDESKRVDLTIYPNNAPIAVRCQNASQKFTGVVVPLTVPAADRPKTPRPIGTQEYCIRTERITPILLAAFNSGDHARVIRCRTYVARLHVRYVGQA